MKNTPLLNNHLQQTKDLPTAERLWRLIEFTEKLEDTLQQGIKDTQLLDLLNECPRKDSMLVKYAPSGMQSPEHTKVLILTDPLNNIRVAIKDYILKCHPTKTNQCS